MDPQREREREQTRGSDRGRGNEALDAAGRRRKRIARRGGGSRMLLGDPQTRIPLPSLARARPERVRDEMTRGEIEEKGRWFIGITMKLRDAGVIDGEVIVTGVADRVDPRDANSSP